jgi:hypothetical protein
MTRSPIWLLLSVATLAVAMIASPATQRAQAQTTAALVRQFNVPGTVDVKYPDVVGVGNRAYVSGSPGAGKTREAKVSFSDQPFTTFGDQTSLGSINGASDYSPTVMTSGPDNAVYAAWISSDDRKVSMRRRDPSTGAWGDTVILANGRDSSGGDEFRSRPEVAVLSTGNVFVFWDEEGRHRFRYSDANGNNFTGVGVVADRDVGSRPAASVGPNGTLAIAYSTATGDVYAAIWNGSSFDSALLTGDQSGYAADPTSAITPDGKVYIAWRFVEGGIWYAERDLSGTWNRSRLVGGSATAYGTVAIDSDAEGNLHMGWGGNTGGKFDFWYAFKPNGQNWQGPIAGTDDSDLDANVSISSTLNDFAYGHMVGERFSSDGLRTRYGLFRGAASFCGGALTLRDTTSGSTEFTDEDPISGLIAPTNCTPQQMQVSLNTPPTAATSKSTYAANISVDVPTNLVGTQCTQTVYVHLYKDANATFSSSAIFSKAIKLDPPGDVDAVVQARNPQAGLSPSYTPFAGDAGTATGASGGDPAWTRTPTFLLNIGPNDDCSGLKSYAVGSITGNITNNSVSTEIALPTSTAPTPGPQTFDVNVSDNLGNLKAFPQTINFDPLDNPTTPAADESGRPVYVSGTLSNDNSSADARKSIFRTLSFSNVNVTDNLYRANAPGSQFWGVWVAIGARNDTSTTPSSTLLWVPIKVSSPGATFTVPINLFNNGPGPRLDQDGTYVVFVRFLDGAGNPTTTILNTSLTLDPGYTLPSQKLPTIVKP